MASISKRKVADNIIDDFKNKLETGVLKEGDKLPNMTQYAKELGVSRLSLREAMQTLEKMGAVRGRPKVGTIITCGDPARWAYPAIPDLFSDSQKLYQLIETRMYFEGILAAQCAKHVQPDELETLRRILAKQKKALDAEDFDEFYRCDTQFHSQIAASSRNAFLQRMYTELLQTTNPSVTAVLRKIPGAPQDALYMHQRILEAIAALDDNSAERCAREHLRRVQEYYERAQSPSIY